jgi:molybdate transport system substrate-binding protein
MRHLLRTLLLLCSLGILLAACSGGAAAGNAGSGSTTGSSTSPINLKVFAAASLTESFTEIKAQYEAAHPNVKITYNFNGSQLLVQQIINGAPADVFASADTVNMQKAQKAGVVNTPQVFVKNKLTVITPASNPGKITSLKDLARKGLKIVVAAPSVPVGKYWLQVLDKMGKSTEYGPAYESAVKANFVSQEDNVKAVVQKVELGEADAGIVYNTDVTPAIASKVKFIEIPDNFNVIAQYPIAVVKDSTQASAAQDFMNYVLSAQGQAVLSKYHFIPVNS